jgi:hypothetical protein
MTAGQIATPPAAISGCVSTCKYSNVDKLVAHPGSCSCRLQLLPDHTTRVPTASLVVECFSDACLFVQSGDSSAIYRHCPRQLG